MPFRSLTFRVAIMILMLACGGPSAVASSEATPEATPEVTEAWAELPPMQRPRSELGAAGIADAIYVVGGFGGETMLDVFDTAAGTWTTGADLPLGVHHPGVAALNGTLYVAGGYAETGATDSVWAYDPAADAWEARAPLPTARGALGLAALDGRLYAVGGAEDHLGGPVTGTVEAYDPAADAWTELAPLPTPREHLAVAAGAGVIFAIGGRANGDEGERFAAAAEAFDPASGTWTTLPHLPTPRGGFAGAVVAGRLVVLGGERGTTTFDTVEAFDPETSAWTALPSLPIARHGVAAVAIGDTLYAVAGSTRAGTVENTGAVEALQFGS